MTQWKAFRSLGMLGPFYAVSTRSVVNFRVFSHHDPGRCYSIQRHHRQGESIALLVGRGWIRISGDSLQQRTSSESHIRALCDYTVLSTWLPVLREETYTLYNDFNFSRIWAMSIAILGSKDLDVSSVPSEIS